MRVIITVSIILLTAVSFPLLAVRQTPPLSPAAGDPPSFCGGIRNKAFLPGETLTYKVSYSVAGVKFATAGEASFNTSFEHFNGKDVYHIIGEGHTYPFYDKFFRVRDKYESYVDTTTLQPYKFIRDVDEGGYKTYENVSFIKSTNTAIMKAGVFKVPECIQDVLSAIFYARNIDFSHLKPNDTVPFDMFLDRQVNHLYVRYLGKETIRTSYAKFRTIKFRPLLVKGTMFEGGEKMTVWVTDDPNHIAVRIESPITVGKVSVDMSYYRNLRYPLSSLIDL